MRLRNVGVLVVAVLSASFAGVASPAAAAPPLDHQSADASSAFDSSPMKGVTVRCPAGTVAVGAGAMINGADGQAMLKAVYPEPSSPMGPPDKAVAIAVETPGGTTANWRLRVFATCIGVAPASVSWVKTTSALNSDSPKTATAACPHDRVLAGTGTAVFSGGDAVVLRGFAPDAALASVRADAFEGSSYAGAWDVTAYAVCVDPVVFEGLSVVTSPQDSSGFVYADCPSDALVLAGGAWIFLGGDALLRITTFYSAGVPRSVGVGVQPRLVRFPAPWYARSYAICATNLRLSG